MGKLTVRVENFKPLRSNTLFGFATIVLPELHLRILDAAVHESHDKRWIGLPAKPQIDREGAVRRDDRGSSAAAQRQSAGYEGLAKEVRHQRW
jgi:hypothetical protein